MQKESQKVGMPEGPDRFLPAVFFRERMERREAEVTRWDRRIGRLSNWRLVVFLFGAGGTISFGIMKYQVAAWSFGVLFLGAFLVLVVLHEKAFRMRSRTHALRDVNRMSWKRLSNSWHDVEEDGRAYEDPRHPFTADLDIFGSGSLFQLCSTAVTPAGKACLADWFAKGEQDPERIRERQSAVCELKPLLEWRQTLQAEALAHAGEFCEADALSSWGAGVLPETTKPGKSFRGKPCKLSDGQLRFMRLLAYLIPMITLICALLPTLLRRALPSFGYVPLVLMLLAEILLLFWRWKFVSDCLRDVEGAAADVRVHQRLLAQFEALPVQSVLLNRMKEQLRDEHGRTASEQAERLAKIVDLLGNRHHQLYIVADILFLLDWHFLFAIEQWRSESGERLGEWVAVNAELEALCSMAALAHAHPDWVMPQVSEDASELRLLAQDAGHPFLGDDCVTNTVCFSPGGRIALITGSNMSGKSTLLRTIGVNLVLTMAGGPVRATRFVFLPGHIFTCMRTRDDIEQGISSFYAELLRVKMLVQAVKAGEQVFFLLDELFKGTNSADRHAGAEALMRWLVRQDAPERSVTGMISTHDLELGSLETSCPGVWNAHFQEWYEDGEVRFDYRLRPGVSTTRNALWLMKLAGLPIEEDE